MREILILLALKLNGDELDLLGESLDDGQENYSGMM